MVQVVLKVLSKRGANTYSGASTWSSASTSANAVLTHCFDESCLSVGPLEIISRHQSFNSSPAGGNQITSMMMMMTMMMMMMMMMTMMMMIR